MSKVLLTGSRVYGPVTENSDIDVVLFKTEANKLLNRVTLLGLNPEVLSDYGDASSFKFVIDGLPPINIIVVEDEVDWYMWEFATNEMKALEPIVNREERIKMFHFFQNEGFNIAMEEEGRKFYEEYKRTHGVQPFTLNPKAQTTFSFTGFVDDDDVNPF